jgi:hypothetical protein
VNLLGEFFHLGMSRWTPWTTCLPCMSPSPASKTGPHLGAFSPLGTVIPRPCTRSWRRLQRPACQPLLPWAAACALQTRATASAGHFHYGLETFLTHPAPRLLLRHRPRRQIVGHHPPERSGLHQPAQRVEHRPQTVTPLRSVFTTQRQIPRYKRPLLITHITRIANPPLLPIPLCWTIPTTLHTLLTRQN